MDAHHGAIVAQVIPNSAASHAGVKSGDIITGVNGGYALIIHQSCVTILPVRRPVRNGQIKKDLAKQRVIRGKLCAC